MPTSFFSNASMASPAFSFPDASVVIGTIETSFTNAIPERLDFGIVKVFSSKRSIDWEMFMIFEFSPSETMKFIPVTSPSPELLFTLTKRSPSDSTLTLFISAPIYNPPVLEEISSEP